MENIKLSVGKKQYRVIDENDRELGIFEIATTDMNFFDRAKKAEKEINGLIALITKEIKDNTDGEQKLLKIAEFDRKIKEQLDYMFDSSISETVFGNRNCMSLVDGVPFVKQFLDVFTPIVKRDLLNVDNIKENPKIAKYLDDYKE